MPSRLHQLAGACLLILIACLVSGANAAPIPIEHFFANPAFSGALLSPDARSLAVRLSAGGSRQRLAVVDLASNKVTVVATYADLDIASFQWVNNQRLVYDTTDQQLAQGDLRYGPGLFAVNRDGSKPLQLASRRGEQGSNAFRKLLPWHTFLVGQRGRQDSEYIYVVNRKYDNLMQAESDTLMRLSTLNGYTTLVGGPGKTRSWMLDHQGAPRLAITRDGKQQAVMYLDPASGKWRSLATFDAYARNPQNAFTPLGFAPDGSLYISAYQGQDKKALYRYDLTNNQIDKAVARSPDFDFSGHLVSDDSKLLGVRYLSNASSTLWLDADMKALQARVDALLPSTVNLLSVAQRAETPFVVVQAYSDVQPNIFLLFNQQTGALSKIGDSYQHIEAAQMSTKALKYYTARDGLKIPAWLTLPHNGGGKNLPLVVLVHGGPWVRGATWSWDAEVQFLASRGYAVLEPEFRGSTGYGARHFLAGIKQWGLAMQDDLADGARWAVAEGFADAGRICIGGASYGGYATLMGLVNDPGLYRCGIDWLGVTDIGLMYNGHWSARSDLTDDWKTYGMPQLIGDQTADAAQLQATSPLAQAARIGQPLLLAYGGADQRVPLYHGAKLRDAVQPHNRNVEWVEYPQEGHGWRLPQTRIDFWGRVEKFLAKHIGAPADTPPVPAPAMAAPLSPP